MINFRPRPTTGQATPLSGNPLVLLQLPPVEDQVRDAIATLFLAGDTTAVLDSSADLLQAGIFDSLGLMELALELEKRFPGIRIDDQEITPANLGSVQRICAFLRARGAS